MKWFLPLLWIVVLAVLVFVDDLDALISHQTIRRPPQQFLLVTRKVRLSIVLALSLAILSKVLQLFFARDGKQKKKSGILTQRGLIPDFFTLL